MLLFSNLNLPTPTPSTFFVGLIIYSNCCYFFRKSKSLLQLLLLFPSQPRSLTPSMIKLHNRSVHFSLARQVKCSRRCSARTAFSTTASRATRAAQPGRSNANDANTAKEGLNEPSRAIVLKCMNQCFGAPNANSNPHWSIQIDRVYLIQMMA